MEPEKDDEEAKASLPPTANAPATKAASRLMCVDGFLRESEVCVCEREGRESGVQRGVLAGCLRAWSSHHPLPMKNRRRHFCRGVCDSTPISTCTQQHTISQSTAVRLGSMSKGGKGGVGDGSRGGGTGGGGPAGQSKKLCQVFLRNLPLTMLEPVSGLGLVARVDGWWTEWNTTIALLIHTYDNSSVYI